MPANHLMLRSFRSLTFLSLTPRNLDNLLKCWSNPQILLPARTYPFGWFLKYVLHVCLDQVVPKNIGADETGQEYPEQCTQYHYPQKGKA